MRLKCLIAASLGAAFFTGLLCGHSLCRSIPYRNAIGLLFGRGRVVALVHGSGIYEQDIARRMQELRYINGSAEGIESDSILMRLVANEGIDYLARNEKISRLAIDSQYSLLQSQFHDGNAWALALGANRLTKRSLWRQIAVRSRAERWIARQLADQIDDRAEECRQYYERNKENFLEPIRFRASHLFLAAPLETHPEVVEAKRLSIEALSTRIARGEKFAELVTLFSEDNATRTRGGDLGFFSEFRMPAEFTAPIRSMQVGEMSPVVRTRLGFHLIQLTEFRGARQLGFDETREEINLAIENEKRRTVGQKLLASASYQADFVR